MQKVAGPVDLSRPYLSSTNATGGGIVHAIDASGKYGPSYRTNDVNLLPDNAIVALTYNSSIKSYDASKAEWLGGI